MKSNKSYLAWVGICFVAGLFLMASPLVQGNAKNFPASPSLDTGSVEMNVMDVFGELERPKVVFPHDRHTSFLEKKRKEGNGKQSEAGYDCAVCHMSNDKGFSTKFKWSRDMDAAPSVGAAPNMGQTPDLNNIKNKDKKSLVDMFHADCILCHRETAVENQTQGPVTCGGCHVENVPAQPDRGPFDFDKSLHFRHVKANENKCESCHHEYDETKKTLVYTKGKESSCRYCHKEEKEGNRSSMRQASHDLCVGCHMEALSEKKATGPILCAGCHDPEALKKIETLGSVPRMEMKQPDAVFIKKRLKETEPPQESRMNRVPFNHKAHEEYNDSCRVCHHKDLASCATCHSQDAAKDGKEIRLEQAMHQSGAKQSCVGCHDAIKKQDNCAGCHWSGSISSGGDADDCAVCHMTPLKESALKAAGGYDEKLAGIMLKSREKFKAGKTPGSRDTKKTGQGLEAIRLNDIPEKVLINSAADKYMPVDFPHRKIVLKLSETVNKSPLAKAFHQGDQSLCLGCHHNSPAAKKPPGCAECHARPSNEKNLFRPGLKAAYHIQCMECHKAMKIETPVSTNCVGCHEKKIVN